ncbi:unnamed protein product, partial [Mesorhabditis belari]|uniref:Uncharacterized protein n=1 Tax=Mesorhabditis belari TaxID=2138241 RepID=A0AAF3J783_9BILA
MTALNLKAQKAAGITREDSTSLFCSISGSLTRLLILYFFVIIASILGFAYYFTQCLYLLVAIGVLMGAFCLALPKLIQFFIRTENATFECRLVQKESTGRPPVPIYTIPSEFMV